MATKVLIIASAAAPFASRFEPALKPNQPTHSSEAPIIVMVRECGAMQLLAVADALADHERADQTGDARIDVHDGAAGEVDRAPLEDLAGVGQDLVELGLRGGLGGLVGRGGDALAAASTASGPAQYQTMWAIGK